MTYKQLRYQSGYTQREVAKITGVHHDTVYRFEAAVHFSQKLHDFYETLEPIDRFVMMRARYDRELTQKQAGELAGISGNMYMRQELGYSQLRKVVYDAIVNLI